MPSKAQPAESSPAPVAAHEGWQVYTQPQEDASAPMTLASEAAASGEPALVTGRIVLNIAPVPAFDRLLSLDGALGRMADVRNVSLADYAKEEVTFRIELDQPISAEAFARGLGESASMVISVVSSAPGSLSLRLN